MQINVSGDTEKAIQRRLAAGEFNSPEEVIRVAISQMDQFEAAVTDIQESLEDERAGKVHSVHDVDRELREKHGFKRPL